MTLLQKHWPVFFFAVFAFVIFWQYFLLDQAFYAGDMAFALLPLGKFAIGRLASGELPLWNPHLLAGTPGLAEPTLQTFYPPSLLLLLLGAPRGMSWLMPLHLFWMALGMYFFARTARTMNPLPAVFCALSCAFGGFMLGGLSIPFYINAASWLPWIVFSYEKSRRGGGPAWTGLCVAMQLLTGAAAYAYYSLALLVAYHCFVCWQAKSAAPQTKTASQKGWVALILVIPVAAGLSMMQLLPQAELAPLTARGVRATYEYVTYSSLAPHHFFVTSLFPGFYGLFDSPTREGFLPTGQLAYIGVPALLCALVALFLSRRRREVYFWLGATAVSWALALGQYNPLFPLLYKWVPGFAAFRWPSHWLLLTVFCTAILAGLGMEALQNFGLSQASRRGRAIAVALGCAVGGMGVLLLVLGNAPAAATIDAWPQIGLVVLTVLLFAALPNFKAPLEKNQEPVAIEVAPESRSRREQWVCGGLIVLLALDLWWFSQQMELQHTLSVAALEATPATVSYLAQRPQQERFWSVAQPVPLELWQAGAISGSPLEFRARSAAATREMMPSCIAAAFPVYGLTGSWGALAPLRRHARPLYENQTADDVRRRWLRLLNIRYELSLQPSSDAQLQPVRESPPFIARDEAALPRAFWVSQARRVETVEIMDIVSSGRIGSETFDPRRSVLLEGDAKELLIPPAPTANLTTSESAVEVVELQPSRVRLSVDAPHDGYVVLMDTPYPGWRAAVDKVPARWEPANWMGRAVRVPAGAHEITFQFEPQSVRLGLFVSLLTALILTAGLAARSASRREYSRSQDEASS